MPDPGLLFPTATGYIVDYLAARLDDPVGGGSPALGTTRYVRVRRSGGVRINRVQETAQYTVDVYDPDDAEPFAQEVRAHASTLAGSHGDQFNCSRYTEYAGPQNSPDPEAPTLSRYRFTFALTLKGTPLP